MQVQEFVETMRAIAIRKLKDVLGADHTRLHSYRIVPTVCHVASSPDERHEYGVTIDEDQKIVVNLGDIHSKRALAYTTLHELAHVARGHIYFNFFEALFDEMYVTRVGHDEEWANLMKLIGLTPAATGDANMVAEDDANWDRDLLNEVMALQVEGFK